MSPIGTESLEEIAAQLKKKIRDIPDFPIKGILFRDITPLLQDPVAFNTAISTFFERYKTMSIDVVAAIESRGYIIGGALADRLGTGFVPIRKPGKLPAEKISQSFTLEYGSSVLEMHRDAIKPGQKVLLVDDLIATGGTAVAAKQLIEQLGGKVLELALLIELTDLQGRKLLGNTNLFPLIQY